MLFPTLRYPYTRTHSPGTPPADMTYVRLWYEQLAVQTKGL